MSGCLPEISIVVPVYNVGATLLTACIESALAQTFTNFELILVDDASTDGSAAVCANFTGPRVRLLRLPQNGGLSNARNSGVKISTGRYVFFLDADDRMHPTLLERLINIARTHDDADIIACGFRPARPDEPLPAKIPLERIRLACPVDAIADALYQHSLNHSACGKLYSRKLCVESPFLPGWYEDLRTFYHLFLNANRIAWTTEPLYLYTDNPASYLHTFRPERAVVLDVTDELVTYMERHHPELVAPARDRALSAAFNMLNLLAVNNCDAPDITSRCRSTIRRYRHASLLNPRVRLKNKLGILLTYIGGFGLLKVAARIFRPK